MSDDMTTFGTGAYSGRPDPETQRYYADNYVDKAINERGITSGDKYYSWLRDQGLGVSRDVAREAWKEFNVQDRYQSVIAVYPSNQVIPRAWYGSTDAKGVSGYMYKVEYSSYAQMTGDVTSNTHVVLSDHSLTIDSIMEQFHDEWNSYEMGQDFTILSLQVVAVYHKAGARW
jgi:hypothetical protein